MGLRGGGMQQQQGGDPELQRFLRSQLLARLGAGMMSSPDPRAIGAGLGDAVASLPDARQQWLEQRRQAALEAQRAEDRQWQLSERQRMLQDRTSDESSMQAEGQRIAQARARLREAGDVNADFYSAKQVDEQYTKRFGFQEPDEETWQIRKGGDGRTYRVNPMTGETDDLEGIPGEIDEPDEINWQMHTNADGSVVQVNPRTGAIRPVKGLTGRSGGGDEEKPLTTAQVASFIEARVRNGDTREEAIEDIQATYPASLLPPSFRPKAASPLAPKPAGVGASVTPPKRSMSIGASADTVTFGGQKVPIAELVEAVKDEPSPAAAMQGLVARGVPAETAKMIVRLAFGAS
jgi:hypothetical protein